MPSRKRLVVLHLAGRYPLGGIGWQALHYVLGLARLGHDVYYVEDSGTHPYDPRVQSIVGDARYSVAFLADVMARFDLGDRWAYVDAVTDTCHGFSRERLSRLYREADAVFNVCGATRLTEEHLRCPVRVYLETDPVFEQIRVAEGDRRAIEDLQDHTHHFTYGENLGQPDCPIPLEKFAWRPTRPPVILDLWDTPFDPRAERFTTVATWKNVGKDIRFRGETYYWSKHINFLRVADLPRRTRQPLEMALQVEDPTTRDLLTRNGWILTDAFEVSRTLTTYQQHIQESRGEFTVAKDLVARTRSGWFSDRSVCYLAAGKPVVTQDTGFGKYLPAGVGLLAFRTVEEAAAALDEVNRDYERHCRAARRIAEEHFAADLVLERLCREADL
ncbi:MAG: glycosyltransferase [Candidatus Rokuibacteriota bacterium]